MKQLPYPDEKLILPCGDIITFTLTLDAASEGKAYVRTNLGRAAIARKETIELTEFNVPVIAEDWHDIEMTRKSETGFELNLPLLEVGCFEAKCYFQCESSGKQQWIKGRNVQIKVEAADTICANTIYTAFVRQFGSAKCSSAHSADELDAEKTLQDKGYSVIPCSGRFRDLINELDFIVNTLRCRIIQLLPIHPTPTVYGKMGRYGSPFAALDFFAVDPEMAEFDRKSTPLEQFCELVDQIHARNAKVFLDIPVNHTGWGSKIQNDHPEWFVRSDNGTFSSPGAWGVTWEDLCKLDYKRAEVHTLMADVFLYWCSHGVDGFRCDAGYMLPFEAWKYITARVRREYPDTIFMLEGLGGHLYTTRALLAQAGLNWAYSELFQNYSQREISSYLPGVIDDSMKNGLLVHFAETHDNNRLAAQSPLYAGMRTALCLLLSHNGAFGITNGVEWFATEKICVHDANSLNWGSPENQIDLIRKMQLLLEIHPAFFHGAKLSLIHYDCDNVIVARRSASDGSSPLLVMANLDCSNPATAKWRETDFTTEGKQLFELIEESAPEITTSEGICAARLTPGAVRCLTMEEKYPDMLSSAFKSPTSEPSAVINQRLRQTLLQVMTASCGYCNIEEKQVSSMLQMFQSDPFRVCEELFDSKLPPLTNWVDGVAQRKAVIVPHGNMLLITSEHNFMVNIKACTKNIFSGHAIPRPGSKGYFCISTPLHNQGRKPQHPTIELTSFANGKVIHSSGTLLLLSANEPENFRMHYGPREIRDLNIYALCTNNLGGMCQVSGSWSAIQSKYDALLAGNCNHEYPVNRTVMLSRCRAWLVCKDYSQKIDLSCQKSFTASLDNEAQWLFSVSVGCGKVVELLLSLQMAADSNCIELNFHRRHTGAHDELDKNETVHLIVRPDIDDRCNHEVTKAYVGPEHSFPAAVSASAAGFIFNPSGKHTLNMNITKGRFVSENEWAYMIKLPLEAERGLEGQTDLFSPGYFECDLAGGECVNLNARICNGEISIGKKECQAPDMLTPTIPVKEAMLKALEHFIVKRNNCKTVIAGYPWFLDWGRDTLICLRGIIAAGKLEDARMIIEQFASFEKQGTLPNMIRGNDDSDRDTSDAPLWLSVAVADYIKAVGNSDILNDQCGSRTLLEVLISIAESYIRGTANGIIMDGENFLIFSPSHFTWMDTNHPAGTPREGYPVEIQALWFAALSLLEQYDGQKKWSELAAKVRKSVKDLYFLKAKGFLSDCLHAKGRIAAAKADADDACRPNQLLAVTLGLIDDPQIQLAIVRSCEQLVVPGAIRTLADSPVDYQLPIYHSGTLLNDPSNPYCGRYCGPENLSRKVAYHNGTAWSWMFPSYCEAMYFVEKSEHIRSRALAILMSCTEIINQGIAGHLPEITDGDFPHKLRGCGAQAWGSSELLRVHALLSSCKNKKNETEE